MDWLWPFVALTLCCGAVMWMLPEGSLKKTAGLVIGLMLVMCWADCLAQLFQWPELPKPPDTLLTFSGYIHPSGGE